MTWAAVAANGRAGGGVATGGRGENGKGVLGLGGDLATIGANEGWLTGDGIGTADGNCWSANGKW